MSRFLFCVCFEFVHPLVIVQNFSCPSYTLISVQPPGRTRSSSLITITRPPSSSSLKITNRSFRYASPSLWNNLPASFRQPRSSSIATITPSSLPLSSIPDLKLTCSTNPSHLDHPPAHRLPTGLQPDCLHGLRTTPRYVLVLPLSSFS